LRQAEESSRQADVAERALRAQTTPLLADVPYGLPRASGYSPMPGDPTRRTSVIELFGVGPHQPHYRDASELHAQIDEHGDKTASLSVPVRNIGLGAAVITSVEFRLLEREPLTATLPRRLFRPAKSLTRYSRYAPKSHATSRRDGSSKTLQRSRWLSRTPTRTEAR
jgi:hypothetical protein